MAGDDAGRGVPDADAAWAPRDRSAEGGGPTLPGYRDLQLIAHGGESRVYRARQDGLDRDVAIKVLLTVDPDTVARFRRELELTVALGRQHPNIVTVLATGTVSTGEPCIVMEHHELGSLHDRLTATGPLPVHEVVAAGTVVADALAFAHAQGVLHRDVKPQNVLLLPTSYVLADFGIARFAGAGHTASAEQFSYRHAAPQVLDGEPPAAADDVWSLGSTLYTLLDGRPPFAALDPDDDTALAYLRRVRTEDPRPLRRDDVPAGLREVIARCLRRDRAERFAGAAEVHEALAAIRTETRLWAPVTTSAATDDPEVAAPEPTGGDEPSGGRADEAFAPHPPPGPVTRSVAASALAVGPEVPVGPDDDATAAGPPPLAPPVEPEDDGEEEGRGFDLRVAVFAAIALLTGVALSIGIALRDRGPAEDTAPPAAAEGAPVPEVDEEIVVPTDPTPDVDDPGLSPSLEVEDRGTSVALRWDDPSDGSGQFVVIRAEPEPLEPVRQYGAGTLEGAVEGLDPDAPRYCFQVLVVTAESRGLSEPRCVER